MDNAGYMKSLSSILNSTGVIDIGRKSDGIRGDAALAKGRIEARFHWFGTTADEMDRFIMSASGLANIGAPVPICWVFTDQDQDGINPPSIAVALFSTQR